jgi:DNA-binding LacI/PurR family transcriptional regulator
MKRAKTLADIARLAGVAESTVSRALKDSPLISDSTRARVHEIAKAHDFHLDSRARSFKTGRSQTLAVVINLSPGSGQVLSDPFLLGLVGCLADEAALMGYDLLFSTQREFTAHQALSYVAGRKADGLLIIGQGSAPEALADMAEQQAHFVVWGQAFERAPYTTVGTDNVAGGYLATRHLVAKGKTRLAFLGDTHHPEVQARYQGFQQALAEAGLTEAHPQVEAAFCMQSGQEQTARLLAECDVDGLVCSSDLIAMGAINALQSKGKQIPAEVAVTGFDNIPLSQFMSPALTTVEQDIRQGAHHMVQALVKKIDGQAVHSTQMAPALVVRRSS